MEKLIYPAWKHASQTDDAFRDTLLSTLGPALAALDAVRGLRVCVADSAVAPGAGRRIESHPPTPDAVLSLWVNYAEQRHLWEPLINSAVARWTAYLVAEAEPLINRVAHPRALGERMYGMCHVVFMSPPAAMDRDEWLSVWKESHTQVAIDTQSTFGYRQNVVVRRLTDDTPTCHAIVEENFPPQAMTDDHAFYATGGDEAVLEKHVNAMMESCSRFIDFAQIDVVPMSEYLLK